jgi:DNA-binding NarL/FixJ family response regulator
MSIRILLVDDQALIRAGFRMILDAEDDLEVVGEAADGLEAVEAARRLRPDVVLMDIRMPELDGIEATRRIVADPTLHGCRVVVLTTYERDEYILEAIQAGASGFLLKDIEPAELRRAVQVVAAGEALLSPSVTRRVLGTVQAQAGRGPKQPERLDVLTDREREVLELVGRGLNNEEIGRELYMSPATAKTHVGRAMMKLHARDRVRLVVIAHETGLVGD